MEQTVDLTKTLFSDATDFYDNLAGDYDAMTGFEKRFIHEKPFFSLLMREYGITSALDAGAGTGFHSLLLGQLGADMTAADVSKKMIDRVKYHAKDLHLAIDVVESNFKDLPLKLHKKFDAVLCMGNSLPHLLTHEELVLSLKSFSAILRPGGFLFLQLLNYARILDSRDRIQSVKEAGGVTFVRSYEFHQQFVVFNILRLRNTNGQLVHQLDSVKLRPILKPELLNALDEAGFENLQVHGSIALDDYHEMSSKDLVVRALKRKAAN